MGTLTRAEMEQVIRDGGSVAHNGSIHWQVSTLPSEADLAGGDADRLDAAHRNVQEQIAALQAEDAKIAAARGDAAKRGQVAAAPVTDLIDDQNRLERQAIIDSQQAYRDEVAAREAAAAKDAEKVTSGVAKENAERGEGETPVGREIGGAEAAKVANEQLASEGAGSPAVERKEESEAPKETHPKPKGK